MRKLLVVATMLLGFALVQPASAGAIAPADSPIKALTNSIAEPAVAGPSALLDRSSPGVTLVQRRRGARRGFRRGWRGARRYGRPGFRRRGRVIRRYYYDDWWDGPGIAGAVTLGLIGALVASGIDRSVAEERIALCESRFRSFDARTGTYVTYGGERRICPYLRG